MKQSYLFYDIETTGLNKCFDQAVQFAAIRTDLDLNEIERFHYKIKLNPDVIPSPYAILTHHISIQQMQTGLSELEAIKKIHQLMNTPGTISLGYNTLGFDDEFLRFSFYRNLLSPYTHQFANGCARMDIYPITVLYYLFKNESVHWPKNDGKLSLKLERLSAENNLAQGPAHDAMVDVEATLALAKKLKAYPEMWEYAIAYFNKVEDLKRLNQLPAVFSNAHMTFRQALLINGKIGSKDHFQAPVLYLGQHRHYKNQSLWLRLDQENLQATHADNIPENTLVIRKRAAEQEMLLPPKERFLKYLSKTRLKLTNDNLAWLEANPNMLQFICDYHQNFTYPVIPHLDADAALYQLPFATREEERVFADFHRSPPSEKERVANRIQNPLRQEQALRLLARHFPAHLSPMGKKQFNDYLQKINDQRIIDFRQDQHPSVESTQKEIEKILNQSECSNEQEKLLTDYRAFLGSFEERY